MSSIKVLISGAGIAGPCLAYWLSKTQLNATITIIERSPSPRLTGQSIDIRGQAIEIVKKMKLEETLRSRHTTEEGTVILNSSGKPIARFDAGDAFTAEYEILRADLSQTFQEVTEKLSNVKYIYGDHITLLEETPDAINVTFAEGSKLSYDLVVAADGSTSKTRSLILDEEVLKNCYNPIGQYIAFFSIPKIPEDQKLWKWYNAPKGIGMMTRPHRNDTTVGSYLCVTMPSKGQRDPAIEDVMDKGIEDKKRVLHKYFENAGWEAKRILEGMDLAEDFYMTRAAQVKLPKWTKGRALVIGDAAFATFGIGTSLAIESAYVLAGELSKIKSTNEVPRALERYEKVFREHYSKMEDLPPGFPQLAFPQTTWGLRIRDCGVWLASKTKVYKLLGSDSEVKWTLPNYEWVGI